MRPVIAGALLTLAVCAPGSTAVTPPGLDEAIRTQRSLLEAAPRDAEVLNDLGNLLALAGETKEAEEVYREALALDPQRVSARYNLALLLQDAGRGRAARRALQAVLKSRPDHAWAHYQLGRLHAEAGKRRSAVRHYARAFALEPRLTLPDVNPHILDNELAIQATLTAFSKGGATGLAPRRYQEPERIRDLLLPEALVATEPSAEDAESPALTVEGAGRIEGGEAAVGSGQAVPTEAVDPNQEEASPEPTRGEDRARDRRARRGRLVRQGAPPTPAEPLTDAVPAQPVDQGGEGSTPATPSEPQGAQEAPQEEPGPGEAEEPEEGGPGYEPDVFSTGRLELRLVPKEAGRVAVLSGEPLAAP